ncbi:MAG TPA: cytochrome c-type biogenesis protein [Burkholderiales bacterium]
MAASRLVTALALALLAALAWAQPAAPTRAAAAAVEDPALEKRVAGLAHELRCLVCQNQTIAESNAPLAVDLRNQIREQLARGASDKDVREFMVARYGDFVLYKPPLKASTIALWVSPFVLLVAGAALLWRRVARRRAPEAQLSEAQRDRAAKLLE